MAFNVERTARWGVAILFFLFTTLMLWQGDLFISPDERMNAFFAQRVASGEPVAAEESLSSTLGDVLYPRSALAFEGRVVPNGFLGLPVLAGWFGRLASTLELGDWTRLWTPLLATTALLAWFEILRRWTGSKRIAWFGFALLALHPAFVYYATRGFLPNVAFTALLVLSIWAAYVQPFTRRTLNAGLAGLLLGAALMTRLSEWWVIVVVFAAAIVYRRRIRWQNAVAFCLGFVVLAVPTAMLNKELYGAPWQTGYTVSGIPVESLTSQIVSTVEAANASRAESWLANAILPFGFHPRTALRNVMDYGIGLFWWMSIPAMLGLWYCARRSDTSQQFVLWSFLIVSAWLALLYGSWVVHDNPDPEAVTIANSYVRYWLPIFVMLTAYAAIGLEELWKRRAKYTAVALLVVGVLGLWVTTIAQPEDGLLAIRARLSEGQELRERVLELTEPEAIIVADRSDKFLFPYRRIRQPLRDETTYALLPKMLAQVPVYHLGITLPPEDLVYLNEQKLPPFGVRIELVESLGIESLYRFILGSGRLL